MSRRIQLLLLALSACAAPLPPRELHRLPASLRAQHGEPIELEVEPGVRLRGCFLPPEYDDPLLVLHFLATPIGAPPGDPSAPAVDTERLLLEFLQRGAGSLVLDMRGVGASDGIPDPGKWPADALIAWQEALRRVDGDPERVIVRGVGLGNLLALSLMEQGIEPATYVFVDPLGEVQALKSWARVLAARAPTADSNPAKLRFNLSPVPTAKAREAIRGFVFVDSNNDSLNMSERRELGSSAARAELSLREERRGFGAALEHASEPLGLEREIYALHSPRVLRSGYCALPRVDLDVMIVHQIGGSETKAGTGAAQPSAPTKK